MKSSKAKSAFWKIWGFRGAFWTPFGPLGTHREFCDKNFFDSAQLDMKIPLGAKFQEKVMDGYPAIVRTHGQTDARTDAHH